MIYMLTPKQEKFVQNIIKGMSQREAYKNSYNASKMKNETIDSKASNLFKEDKIRTRYEELIKKTEDEAVMSAIERKKWLTKVVTGEVKHTSYDSNGNSYDNEAYISDKMKAIDILNKMDSLYTVPIKGDVTLSYENALKKVSDDDEY